MNSEIERVPYGLPVHDHEEENAVLEVIKSHKTIMGEKVKKFENEVATLFGKKFGIMVNSGSTSTNTGINPAFTIGDKVVAKVRIGVITSEPDGISTISKAKRFADEPELTMIPNFSFQFIMKII